jgi:hypothetical protein
MGTAYLQQAIPGLTDPRILRLIDDIKSRKR